MSELKPCAHCGGPSKVIRVMGEYAGRGNGVNGGYYGPQRYRVVCAGLYEEPIRDCPGRVVADTPEGAITSWNQRTPDMASRIRELEERVSQLREKLGARDRGETVLLLGEADHDKAACELDDASLAKWARWALIRADESFGGKAEKEGRSVMEVMSLHAVVTLACLTQRANATEAKFSVEGATWKGEPNGGDWEVTIRRTDARTPQEQQ